MALLISFGVLLSLLSISIGTSDYTKTSDCQETHTCVYDYTAIADMHNKKGKEKATISTKVHLTCESVGIYMGAEVTHFCIEVKNLTSTLSQVMDEQTQETENDHENSTADSYINYIMSDWFCFVRNSNGKILGVFHPAGEGINVVNFKKSIAAAFQVNFAGTQDEDETDSQSHHTSHYSYTQNGVNTIQHRIVDRNDVFEYSGDVPKKNIGYHIEEDVEVDDEKTVYRSRGTGYVALAPHSIAQEEEESMVKEEATDEDIPPLETEISYDLELISCNQDEEQRDSTSGSKSKRSNLHMKARLDHNSVVDTLLAKWDQAKDDRNELSKNLPKLDETVRRVARDVDGEKLANNDLMKWRRLLLFESKHGPLTGQQSKLIELTERLDEILNKEGDHYRQTRLLIYGLLSGEGSAKAQKALMKALESNVDEQEYNVLVLAITMLTSVHPSTESFLRDYMEHNNQTGQLLLTYASLGRHDSVEDSVVQTLVKKLAIVITNIETTNDTSAVIHLIHALGNTGSKQILPFLQPFIYSLNPELQLTAIDALRTVSRNENVQETFTFLVKHALFEDQVIQVVQSLLFPFKQSVYFMDPPVNPGVSETEQTLMKAIVKSAIRFQSMELNKVTKSYLKKIGTELAFKLNQELQNNATTRSKRADTTDWNSYYYLYDVVASQSSRSADETNYPYHKAYLWATRVGPSKIHAKVAAGGFGGVGLSGHKLFARGIVELYAYEYTYTAVEVEYLNQRQLMQEADVKLYARICGTTYINEHNTENLPYTYSVTKNIYNLRLFYTEYSIWIWVGYLNIYIGSTLTGDIHFGLTVDETVATASFDVGPTISVYGGTSATVLAWRIGLEVSASIGYYITPEVSATFCDFVREADTSTCLGIYHGVKGGVYVELYAYYQSWGCRISSWKLRCGWSGKKKLSLFSTSWNFGGSYDKNLIWGECNDCSCPGPLHEYCDPSGSGISNTSPGTSVCDCAVTALS